MPSYYTEEMLDFEAQEAEKAIIRLSIFCAQIVFNNKLNKYSFKTLYDSYYNYFKEHYHDYGS